MLFDAIERSFDGLEESAWIRNLYEGRTENFVVCKSCGKESTKTDEFLDLQLIIRSDFDNVTRVSIDRKLRNTDFNKPFI